MMAFSVRTNLGVAFRSRFAYGYIYQLIQRSPSPLAREEVVTILPSTVRRAFLSSSPQLEQQDGGRKWTLVYHRNPSRTKNPRMIFGVSTFNLAYWSWYVIDFTPSVNASAHAKAAAGLIDAETLELMLIDQSMGYVGLGMASVISLGAFFYTRQLVSAIWASTGTSGEEGGHSLAVSTLKLPFLSQPKILGRTVYDPESNDFDAVEDIVFLESELMSESSVDIFAPGELTLAEEKRRDDVMGKLDGEFSRLRGHIALKHEDGGEEVGPLSAVFRSKYLLDIESEAEFMPNANPTLLRSLVLKDYHFQVLDNKKGRNDAKGHDSKAKEQPITTHIGDSIQRKKGFRKKSR